MNTAPILNSGSPGRFHWRSRIARRWNAALILSLTFFVAFSFLGTSPTNADDTPEEFKAALRAQDLKEWKSSAELLGQALTKRQEDGKLVRRYGGVYSNYLPHYYIGLALFHQEDCAGALREWDLSLRIGAIQTVTSEYDTLLRLKDKCTGNFH